MAVNFDDFDMGPVWAGLSEDQRNDILSIVYGRLATFGIPDADSATTTTQQSAVAIYARKLAEVQSSGEDIDIPPMVREMLTIRDRNTQLRPVSLFSDSTAMPMMSPDGNGGLGISEDLRNRLVVGGSFDDATGDLTLNQNGGTNVVIDLSNLQSQNTIFGVPEGKDGQVLRYNNGQAFFDTPGGSFYFTSDLAAVWAGVSDSGTQDPLEIVQEAVPGSSPARTWQESNNIIGLFRGEMEDIAFFRNFSLFPNRAVISTDADGNAIRDNDGNNVYELENPYIIIFVPGTLTSVKQRPRDGASDGSDDEEVLANFANTGTVMLNVDGTNGPGETAYTRYAWNYPPTRQPRRNQFSETSGSNEVRLLVSYNIPLSAAPDPSQRAITNDQIQKLLSLADNPMGAANLNDLQDVDVAGATNGMVLRFQNGNWIAATLDGGLDRNAVIAIIEPEIDHLYESAEISGRNLVLTTHGGDEDDVDIVTPVVTIINDFLLPTLTASDGQYAVRRSGEWVAEDVIVAGLNQAQVDARIGQLALNESQTDARVRALVSDWAEQGDTTQIPADKLTLAPAGGLNQTQVDARVRSVAGAAHVGVTTTGTALSFSSLAGAPDNVDIFNPVSNSLDEIIPAARRIPALGSAGQIPAVNAGATGLEFIDPPMAPSGGGGSVTHELLSSVPSFTNTSTEQRTATINFPTGFNFGNTIGMQIELSFVLNNAVTSGFLDHSFYFNPHRLTLSNIALNNSYLVGTVGVLFRFVNSPRKTSTDTSVEFRAILQNRGSVTWNFIAFTGISFIRT